MVKKIFYIVGMLLAGSVLYVQAAGPVQERWINATYVKNGAVDTGNPSAKLAVRSGPGLNFSQIDALPAGRKVIVLENKDGWIRIDADSAPVAPAAAPAVPAAPPEQWINEAYIKNGIVDTGNPSAKLAVRTGPGLNHSTVDALSPGQKVTILETRNGWIRIAPVAGTQRVIASVAKQAPAQSVKPVLPAPVTLTAAPPVRPVLNPVRPPVENLILNGDFSTASLALPTAAGDTTAELSGRWLRSVAAAWEISPAGGNLGPYVRAAASRQESRLLYVVSDAKRSTGSYVLRFDYILTDPADALGVKVFVSDRDITVGTDGGDFRMNSLQRPSDMLMLPSSVGWSTYNVPVELGAGYDYIYVLFTGSGAGNTGIDNVSLSPRRR